SFRGIGQTAQARCAASVLLWKKGQRLRGALQKRFLRSLKSFARIPVDIPQDFDGYSCGHTTGEDMGTEKSEILQGTLDLMVLKTLETMGPLHGYGIARRIEQISEEA